MKGSILKQRKPGFPPGGGGPKTSETLAGKELFRFTLGALGAALLAVAVFGAGAALLILFCVRVWFR